MSEDARVPKLPPAYRLIALDSVTSTNDEARTKAEEGVEDGTLIWAREQKGGRGRLDRSWTSPPGNLYLSLVLRPQTTLAEAAQLSFVAALALGDAIGSVAPPLVEVTYKWPNDVLANGRKVAGILLESRLTPEGELDYVILGLGANIKSFPEDTPFPATSLRFEGAGGHVDEAALLEAFARHFLNWVNRWLEEGFSPIRKTWLKHAQSLGEEIAVTLPTERLSGTFKDLDEDGRLVLALDGGEERRISAGDVYFEAR